MQQSNVVQISQFRTNVVKQRPRSGANKGKRGSVFCRSGKLWVDFRYQGHRVREPSGLLDTRANKDLLRKQLDLITVEIDNNLFEFAERFPHSKKKDYFTILEGKTVRKKPGEILFGDYVKSWWKVMGPGMSQNQVVDYDSCLRVHVLPYFGKLTFAEITPFLLKKFLAQLKSTRGRRGKLLSAKRIRNIFIPLRVIFKDAVEEYDWFELRDPFVRLKFPLAIKFRVLPFTFEEWAQLIEQMPTWYRPYFDFAVQTGLRPSEQIALKWQAIDSEFVNIELSRVRNLEKSELKTAGSRRLIRLRPCLVRILERQKEITAHLQSPYVFVNMKGDPVTLENLRSLWKRVFEKSGLRFRRMYETRHTFASWALALGETPEWVARILGHVDTSMVYRTYGRYIPNLTKLDGSVFDRHLFELSN